jgi:hypothetical protein
VDIDKTQQKNTKNGKSAIFGCPRWRLLNSLVCFVFVVVKVVACCLLLFKGQFAFNVACRADWPSA